jgi:predicted RecA/RadA family phage recombinase
VELEGVYNAQPKATGEAWAVGQKVYYDAGNARFTTTASTHVWAGWAFEVAQSAATTGVVKLKC